MMRVAPRWSGMRDGPTRAWCRPSCGRGGVSRRVGISRLNIHGRSSPALLAAQQGTVNGHRNHRSLFVARPPSKKGAGFLTSLESARRAD